MEEKIKSKKQLKINLVRLQNSRIDSVKEFLRDKGYNVNTAKHKAIVRLYAEIMGLTIPNQVKLKEWLVQNYPKSPTNRRLKPTKKTIAQKFAQANRKKMTVAAKRFRTMMDNARIKIKSEYCIPNETTFYLIDFYIPIAKMCVEIDGEYHNEPEQKEYDHNRDVFLLLKGYQVRRITNQQMMNFESVVQLRNYLGI